MAASVSYGLRERRNRLRVEQGLTLRQAVLDLDAPEAATRAIVAEIDRQTVSRSGWRFVMIGPVQNAAVVEWLAKNSARPMKAVLVWTWCLASITIDVEGPQEVTLSRDELAERCGISADLVSQIMGELESICAISRVREKVRGMRGSGVARYFVNADIATHLTGAARDAAQAAALPLLAPVRGKPPALRVVGAEVTPRGRNPRGWRRRLVDGGVV